MSFTVPIRELTSPAAVLRIAAELIDHDMRETYSERWRLGCCAAFNRLRDSVGDSMHAGVGTRNYLGRDKREFAFENIGKAQRAFENLFRADGARRTKDATYWMGTRSFMGQKRRIAALLATAEVV